MSKLTCIRSALIAAGAVVAPLNVATMAKSVHAETDPVESKTIKIGAIDVIDREAGKADALPELPLSYARVAVERAIAACATKSFKVSATVVNAGGQMVAFGRGDGATPHTNVSSFRKAYTVVTLGPVFGFSKLGTFTAKIGGKPEGAAIASLPDILLLAGAVAIEKDGVIVGALGVGGAPGGDKDEACAADAIESMKPL